MNELVKKKPRLKAIDSSGDHHTFLCETHARLNLKIIGAIDVKLTIEPLMKWKK